MLITHRDLCEQVQAGLLDAPAESINGSSIDVRLGKTLLVEARDPGWKSSVQLSKEESPVMREFDLQAQPFALAPRQFVLAHTQEYFQIPANITGFFCLRSTLARAGLQHSVSIGIKPGWRGNLTLELFNASGYHTLILEAGIVIGDVYFFAHDPVDEKKLYRGRYQGAEGVAGSISAMGG